MLTIDFTSNPNGKLFNDCFGDIRLFNYSFQVGTECEICFRGQFLGYAKIEVARSFTFSRLNDAVSFLNCGRCAPYQASLLNRYYNGGKMLDPDTHLQHLVFSWIQRTEEQDILMKDWWESKSISKIS